jgi:hypothetical protein
MRELQPGLWYWEATHPALTPEKGGPDGCDQQVTSYAIDLVLPTHGGPTDRAALERALS